MSNYRKELQDSELDNIVGGNICINTVYNQLKNTTTGYKYNITIPANMTYQNLADWITNNRTSLGGDNGTVAKLIELGWIDSTPVNL